MADSCGRPENIWKMSKAALISEAQRLGIPVYPSWSAAEVRSLISEHRERYSLSGSRMPPKVTSMTLKELLEMAKSLGVNVPEKHTKGLIIRLIREKTESAGERVVPFGRHKGWQYREVPEGYLRWAIQEVTAKGSSASEDLIHLARYGEEKMKEKKGQDKDDPEFNASIPYVPDQESGSSWSVLESQGYPKAASHQMPMRPGPRGKRTTDEDGKSSMDQEVPEDVADEITQLETRLALLRDRSGIPPRS
jgi:uncharacterized protein (DUF3820 family)